MYYRKNKSRSTKLTNVAVVWFFAVVALAALVVGQDDPAGDRAVVLGEATSESDGPMAVVQGQAQAIQTLTFNKEMTVKDALRFLALR